MASASSTRIDLPINRGEGDLELRIEMKDGTVEDAWSVGTMYRGMENILVGRHPLDALVITMRVCGMCNVAHLYAAALALDAACAVKVPDNGQRLRNVTLMVEHAQSDIRHAFLLFAPDFVNPVYRSHPLFEEAGRRYQAFQGSTAIETLQETKKAIEIIAILGGQWPHSAFMVPGGVASNPGPGDLLQCLHNLTRFRQWYERRVLGCTIGRWREVRSASDLDAWVEENESQREGEVGFFVRFARAAGLDRIGRGHGNYLSFGSLDMPETTSVVPPRRGTTFVASGFARGTTVEPLDPAQVTEQVAHSWFREYEGGRHPFEGETRPYASGEEGARYSWAKAPRYRGLPTETGPLAERVVERDPLFTDLVRNGPSVFARQLARLTRPATFFPAIETWLGEMAREKESRYYAGQAEVKSGRACGMLQAARGALGHWVEIQDGRISRYQIITPTTWNASPRDSQGVRGPWEESVVGTPVRDPENPVEVAHIVRSHDPCMVCCVHTLQGGRAVGKLVL